MTKTSADNDAIVIDARAMRCPWPVLRAARAMRSSVYVRLLADDPIALKDIPDLAAAHEWQCDVEQDDGFAVFHLRIK